MATRHSTQSKAPIKARTFQTENFDVELTEHHIDITEKSYIGAITIPRSEFDRLVHWYMTGRVK